jgi:heme/copper-type cytochrome/quinol oxidase subunit 3
MTLALPPAPAPARPRVLMVATSGAVAAGAMLFAGLIGIYLAGRAAQGPWRPDEVSLPLTQSNVMLVTLLMSSVMIQWAVTALSHRDRRNTYLALGLTVLLGGAFVNSSVFFMSQLGIGAGSSRYAVIVYSMWGAQLAVMIGAIVFAALMAFRALGGQFSGRDREGIAAAALFWHFAVAAFVVVNVAVVWFK